MSVTVRVPLDSTDLSWDELPQGTQVEDGDGDVWVRGPSGWRLGHLLHQAHVRHPSPVFEPFYLLVPLPITPQDLLTALEGVEE